MVGRKLFLLGFLVLWIVYTFLAPKNHVRLRICLYILLLITLSAHEITIYSFHISFAYILMLIVSYSFVMKQTGTAFIYFLLQVQVSRCCMLRFIFVIV